jgi:hypothetical protein
VVDGTEIASELQVELDGLTPKMHLMMMAGAALNGAMVPSGMLDEEEHVHSAFDILTRLGELSNHWADVQTE